MTLQLKASLVATLVLALTRSDTSNVASFVPVQTSSRKRNRRTIDRGLTYRQAESGSSKNEGPASVTLSDMPVVVSPRKRQIRRKSSNRRPKNYWTDSANVERELRQFWKNLNITIEKNEPPPIPNEALLNHFERHDLRSAIVMQGGRQALSHILGGARIMPGKWAEAVETSPELKKLIRKKNLGLSKEHPPLSPQQKKECISSFYAKRGEKGSNTKGNKSKRGPQQQQRKKPKGYWNIQVLIQELYDYLDDCHENMQRPAVWMPRPSELEDCGRQDLKLAMARFGGSKKIRLIAGLVPYREWHYFEGQLELFVELKQYLDKYHDGNQDNFPSVTDMKRNGHEQLHRLVQQYGGRKFVAGRLSMKYTEKPHSMFTTSDQFHDLDWGTFSLDFGIRLLSFIRADQMTMKAPLRNPAIFMPSKAQLVESGPLGVQLDKEINEFGGYENVGRRLGLAISLDPRFRPT